MSDSPSLALVTGAAGGIGEAICARLSPGRSLLCVDSDQVLAGKAAAAAGAGAVPVACDLSDRDAVAGLCARIEGDWADRLELVFLNAGVVERALRKRRLEHFLPYSDSILCRILESFPWLVPPMLGPAEAIGRRGRAKYLARKGIAQG